MAFDTDTFIELIRQRPGLWDIRRSEYLDKTLKKKTWNEVFCKMVRGFETLSPVDNLTKSRDMLRRWKSLRDSFTRELSRQKSKTRTSKPYIHFDRLTFLTSAVHIGDRKQNLTPVEEEVSYSAETEYSKPNQRRPKHLIPESDSDGNELMNDLNDTVQDPAICLPLVRENSTEDSDTLFILSLLEHLRSVPEETKLLAKAELIQVLAKYNYPHLYHPSPHGSSVQPYHFQKKQPHKVKGNGKEESGSRASEMGSTLPKSSRQDQNIKEMLITIKEEPIETDKYYKEY